MILEIINHPHNMQVKFGSSITLTCTSSISSNVTFTWTQNITINKAQSTVNGDTSRLTISNVRYNDGGSYVWNAVMDNNPCFCFILYKIF